MVARVWILIWATGWWGFARGAGRVLLLGVWGGGQEAWGGVIAWLLAVTDLTVGLHTGPANKPLIFR